MDVTYYKTIDNIQYYIYTIVDNFSRQIVAYDVSKKLSANIRLETLKSAIKNEFDISVWRSNVDLIVDGGTENNNNSIHEFIKNQHVSVNKKIALKDVRFSNSIIEGTYRILKSKYFQDRPILSTSTKEEMDFFVNDFNNVRSHYEHKIYIPNDIFKTPSLKDLKPILEKSHKSINFL
ncbi:integrase catalytic domain-containing protein [Polaribacter porphyrae]|uniref:Integrase catalytic domain-containing protein n=1 Tax=Polaribacter porphyrae TaxID=1137780 RepID=A0A2S7WQD7_9FLAO|nr:DDE-type integrase/transposase/recombinase [Polaribacter porphyrae]PQJ79803.1 hypothetical protein BTO18_11735 [Polaribacter porphyrae]